MYCNNCGARIERDGSSFCPYCGAPLDVAPPDDPSASDAAPTGAADVPGPKPADAPGPAPAPAADKGASPAPRSGKAGRRGRRPVVLVVVALVAAVAAAGGVVWWKSEQDRQAAAQAAQAAWDAAHAERSVRLTIVAPGYTSAATRIPLEVTGTDLDGDAVTRTEYVGADDPSISLQQGSYEIRVTASPILEDGSLYSLPEGPVGVTVGDDEATADGTIELAAVDDPASVTDEQIAAAKAAAEADPQDDGRAESLAQSAVARRDDAVAAKKAAEEEKAAAEEAARQAEAQATQDKRQEVAKDFAVAYETTAVSPSGSYTSTDNAVLMSDSEWFGKVEPLIGSTVGHELEHGFMGPSDRKLMQRAHDPRILKVDGGKYYVEYEVTTWSQNTGWSTGSDYASVLVVTLDDDNRVISARYGQ